MDNPTITKADLLPVTQEDEKRADDWATMIGRMGGVILDLSQRRGLATQFAAHRVAALGAIAGPEHPPVTIAKDVLLVQAFADLEWLVKDNEANPAAIALATRHRHSASSGAAGSGEDASIIGLLRALASDCRHTDGWEDGANTCERAADRLAALSPEARSNGAGMRKALSIAIDGLYQVIALDHHNMGPESKATTVARAHVNSAKATITTEERLPGADEGAN